MVAGAGTYALGRAAIVYFLEGVTLKDARRILSAQPEKKAARARLPAQRQRTTDRAGDFRPVFHAVPAC